MENKLIISEQAIKTLRDEIAIAAMQGLLSNTYFGGNYELLVKSAYKISDEMLKARKEKDNA